MNQTHREECLEAEIRRLRQYLQTLMTKVLLGDHAAADRAAKAAKEYLEATQ